MDELVGISYNYSTDRNWYSIRKNYRDGIFPGVCSACVTTYCVENNIVTEYRRFTLADTYILSIDRVLKAGVQFRMYVTRIY